MASPKLRKSWAVTLRHLAASRFYLPERLASADTETCRTEIQMYLHHNGLGLALDKAMVLGDLTSASGEYWRELHLAATHMGASEQLAIFGAQL